MESPLNETTWQRANRDTLSAFHTLRFWLLDILGVAIFTLLVLLYTPSWISNEWKIIYQILVPIFIAVIGLVTLFFFSLVKAPYKQRDEARQRIKEIETEAAKPKLFDVLCSATSLGLPINKLNDDSFKASAVGISPKPLQILHRGELTTINRFTMTPRILFVQKDKGWETTTAITLLPSSNPLASSRTRGLSWDATNSAQWVLEGLPWTLAKDESITLPMIMISVKDGNEVGSRLDKGQTCILTMIFGIFTDKGSPLLPDQQISLTRSDMKVSIYSRPDGDSTQ
jgi:hypothetical protein